MAPETLNIQPQKGNKQVQEQVHSTWPTGHCNATPAEEKTGQSVAGEKHKSMGKTKAKVQVGEKDRTTRSQQDLKP